MESAYPGFGDVVVQEHTDHVHINKPVSKADPAYARVLELLRGALRAAAEQQQQQQQRRQGDGDGGGER